MLDLKLREEFRRSQIRGTTVDFDPNAKTGALKVSATDFLKITYPSHDLLKLIEAIQPRKSRPVVVLGDRGQGKSHLLATVYHLCQEPEAGKSWLNNWAGQLNNDILQRLIIPTDLHIIAESLHHQRYKHLWDLIFALHPSGQRILGKWQAILEKTPGDKSQAGVPNIDLMRELFQEKPTILILDEFQTWYDGLTNTKQYPWKSWAFNFIQILSEIAEKEPDLLTLIVSIRDGQSDAYQQIHRVNPVRVDFKGEYAKLDRRRLLLHRLFENRRQIPMEAIQKTILVHLNEFFRLFQIPQVDQEYYRQDFVETWPFSPFLLKLLDDQVLVATEAQEARDLIRILVDLFKNAEAMPVITSADFSLTNDKSGVVSLLDSVANETHRQLRSVAIHNLEAVKATSRHWQKEIPHCEELLGSLWLRSLTMGHSAGAMPNELQLDVTRSEPIDDNAFTGELTSIRENSFNIHEVAGRLLFRNDENAQAKLLAHARNDKLFEAEQDIVFLAKQIHYVLYGENPRPDHLIVMGPKWRTVPWEHLEKVDHPDHWDARPVTIVIPEYPDDFNTTMGTWLKQNMTDHRNAVRFLFPNPEYHRIYDDRTLMIRTRSVYLADAWKESGSDYPKLKTKLEKELRDKIKDMFDRYAVLDIWHQAEPVKCRFHLEGHQAKGDKILGAMDKHILENLFAPEDFEEFVLLLAANDDSVYKLLWELKEPRMDEKPCIPWIGDVLVKEKLIDLAASGKITINIRGTVYQALPGEDRDTARNRMKGKIGSGNELKETTLHLPDPNAVSGGATAPMPTETSTMQTHSGTTPPTDVSNPFATPTSVSTSPAPSLSSGRTVSIRKSAEPTSKLNLRGRLEQWGIANATKLSSISIRTEQMTGAQLQEWIKNLPDGLLFTLELDKEVEE